MEYFGDHRPCHRSNAVQTEINVCACLLADGVCAYVVEDTKVYLYSLFKVITVKLHTLQHITPETLTLPH